MVLARAVGAGSLFEVGIVRDRQGREWVTKRCRPGVPEAIGGAALQREASILKAARTPVLPELHCLGVDHAGPYLLQSVAAGNALRIIADNAHPHLDARLWMQIARVSSGALAFLHAATDARGALAIVHGDISPDNVFFCAESAQITFIDFSSAHFRDGPAGVLPDARGTLPYVAPEIVRAETSVSQASDTYALAAVLLGLAVGPLCRAATEHGRLFEVGSEGVLRDRIHERRDLPRQARDAIAAALAFEPRARLSTSEALAHALASGPP